MNPPLGPAVVSSVLSAAAAASPPDRPPTSLALRFGPGGRFELQAHERRLLVDGTPAVLGSRAFDLLLVLAYRPGQLLAKGALLDLVWPGAVVEENNLAAQISALRKVLGGELIATLPGRGYCFTGRTEALAASAAQQTPDPSTRSAAAGAPLPSVAADLAQTPAHTAQRTNLPGQLTPLIGRDADLAALGVLVQSHRLITLVGAGGLGKTRLAQAFLHRQRAAWQHGACAGSNWPPSPIPQALPDTIAAALGLRPGAG